MGRIQFRCPQCGTLAEIDDSASGQMAACPGCGSHVVVHGLQSSFDPSGPSSPPSKPPAIQPRPAVPSDADRASPVDRASPHARALPDREASRFPGDTAPEENGAPLRPIVRTGVTGEPRPEGVVAKLHLAAADDRAERRSRRNLVLGLSGAAILFLLLAVLLKLSG